MTVLSLLPTIYCRCKYLQERGSWIALLPSGRGGSCNKDLRHDRNLILFWSRANLDIAHLLCQEPWRRIQEFGSSIRWKFRVSAALKLLTSNINLKPSGICNSVPLHSSYITSARYVALRGIVPPFMSAPMSMAVKLSCCLHPHIRSYVVIYPAANSHGALK